MPLLMADKQKIASVILGKMNGSKVEEQPMPMSENDQPLNVDIAMEAAAQSFINGVKTDDAKLVAKAFSDMCELMDLAEGEQDAPGEA